MKILRKPMFLFNNRPIPPAPQARPISPMQVDGSGVVSMMTDRFPAAVAMLRAAGLSNLSPQLKTYGCNCLQDEVDYSHILEHCCAVGAFVQILSGLLVGAGVWSEETQHRSITLALLHDCAKRLELAFFSRSHNCPVHCALAQSREAKYQYTRGMLRELGFPAPEISLIDESQSCSDLEQLTSYSRITSHGAFCITTKSMQHLIVQLGDACTATNYNGVRGSAYMHPAMRISSTGLKRRFPHFPRVYAVTTENSIRAISSADYSSTKEDLVVAYPAVPFLREVAHAFAYSLCSLLGQQVEHPLEFVLHMVSRHADLAESVQ